MLARDTASPSEGGINEKAHWSGFALDNDIYGIDGERGRACVGGLKALDVIRSKAGPTG